MSLRPVSRGSVRRPAPGGTRYAGWHHVRHTRRIDLLGASAELGLRNERGSQPGFGPTHPPAVQRQRARTWGEFSARATKRGRPRPHNDSWIAACCLNHGLALATLNLKDFDDFRVYEGLSLRLLAVGAVEGRRPDTEQNISRAGNGIGDLGDPQPVDTAVGPGNPMLASDMRPKPWCSGRSATGPALALACACERGSGQTNPRSRSWSPRNADRGTCARTRCCRPAWTLTADRTGWT